MDTSKEYIKMCEGAEEIQGKWQKNCGDFFTPSQFTYPSYIESFSMIGLHFFEKDRVNILDNDTKNLIQYNENAKKVKFIWLPRQDQLQEMINVKTAQDFSDKFIGKDGILVEYLDPSVPNKLKDEWLKFNSMEQLWLAFVMKEKYSKHWNGKEWKLDKS